MQLFSTSSSPRARFLDFTLFGCEAVASASSSAMSSCLVFVSFMLRAPPLGMCNSQGTVFICSSLYCFGLQFMFQTVAMYGVAILSVSYRLPVVTKCTSATSPQQDAMY
jgi:hypothetical protein